MVFECPALQAVRQRESRPHKECGNNPYTVFVLTAHATKATKGNRGEIVFRTGSQGEVFIWQQEVELASTDEVLDLFARYCDVQSRDVANLDEINNN
ncbi:TPA: hypothetical protein ACH3X1_010934 [Trebouxia sp. C0004]